MRRGDEASSYAEGDKASCYKAEPGGFTSLRSVVSSVNVKVFEDDVLLG